MRRGAGGSHGLPPPELAAQVALRSPARRRWRPSAVRFLTLFTAGCFALATTGAAAADAPAPPKLPRVHAKIRPVSSTREVTAPG